MQFLIADTFPKSLAGLAPVDQAHVKAAAFDFQMNPAQPGNKYHRLAKAAAKDLWSFRVDKDIRIITYQDGDRVMLLHADHHDAAYRWAETRRVLPNPGTGVMQIVETEERVEEVVRRIEKTIAVEAPLFEHLDRDTLLSLGVPDVWIDTVRRVGESAFFEIGDSLPAEAVENLLRLLAGQPLSVPEPVPEDADPFTYGDAQRRFRVIGDDQDLLRKALDKPMDAWVVFLHPSQREPVERRYRGPAKISGGAGTGKTVVALHRAAHLARRHPDARILLTTYTRTLAARLAQHLDLLLEPGTDERERVRVEHLHALARRLFEEGAGTSFRPLDDKELMPRLERLARENASPLTPDELAAELRTVIDPQGIDDPKTYLYAHRHGAGRPWQKGRRVQAWKVLGKLLDETAAEGILSWDRLCHAAREGIERAGEPPFTFVLADEVQDFGPAELALLRALAPEGDDSLFLAGDVGQRIYRAGTSYARLGIEVRGRSTVLRLNYRTTEQIRRYADALLPGTLEGDDDEEERRDTVSLLRGPAPDIVPFVDPNDEARHVAERLERWVAAGLEPGDIALFARSKSLLERARLAVRIAGLDAQELSDDEPPRRDAVAVGTMHRAKGLEFRAVVVIGAEQGELPPRGTLLGLPGDKAREEFRERERSLLYVACTRAREGLVVTHVGRPSEFLAST